MYDEKLIVNFAAANTTKGFRNYFPRIFSPDELERIFILKGGPGTGKSSFMRIISQHAQKIGYHVEEFLCSSDPRSLDGVLIRELKMAILDGTSPHTADPTYPGVVENIINTGAFWNCETLCKEKSSIISMIQEKKRYFKRAYQFLNAYGEITSEIRRAGDSALLLNKMEAFLQRLCNRILLPESESKEEIRVQTAIHSSGIQNLNSFELRSHDIYVIEDHLFSGYMLLQKLYQIGKTKKQNIVMSPSCIFPDEVEALYFPERSCCFVLGERNYENELPGKKYHYINMERFLDKDGIRENRQKIRFGKRCSDMLLSGAIDAFSEASKVHFDLEKLYISAMDFDRFNQMTEAFLTEHFST